MNFIGIDLASSEKRPSAVAVLGEGPGLVFSGMCDTDAELLELAARYRPAVVGIDAPLGLPMGMHCLEDNCVCEPLMEWAGRAGEQLLSRRGIGCFFTTKRSIIRKLVYRGIGLSKALRREEHTAIEVYPYATRRILFGDGQPRKQTPEGLARVHEGLTPLVAGLGAFTGGHDEADAVLAAYTAYLFNCGRTESIGIPEESCIVVPDSPMPGIS